MISTLSSSTQIANGGRLLAIAQAERLEHLANVLEVEMARNQLPLGRQLEMRSRIDRHRRDAVVWRDISAMAKP